MHFCRLLEASFPVPGRNFPGVLDDKSQWAPDEGFVENYPDMANVIRLNWENNLHETKILFLVEDSSPPNTALQASASTPARCDTARQAPCTSLIIASS